MSDVAIGLTGIGLVFLLIALRVPIAVALFSVSFGGIWMLASERAAWGILKSVPFAFTASWSLSSVPMFLLMGYVCYHAGLTQGLFHAARLWLSRLPGGLAISAVFGAAGFSAVTGSSVACAAAMGRIAIPEMLRYNYDAKLATGTLAAAGTLGALIPPSILMIIYGIVSQVPINALFLGGVGAGIATLIGYVLVIVVRIKLNPELAPAIAEQPTMAERVAALRETWPVMLLIVGVLGGLFSGIFTATEAGAVGASFSIAIAAVRRSLSWEVMRKSIFETIMTSAALLLIAAAASVLSRFVVMSGAGDYLAQAAVELGVNPYLLLVGIALLYLFLGMFLEPMGAMLLTVPVVIPVIDAAGFSLVWFGVIMVKFLEVGMITPPVGLNVFVIKGVVGNLVSTTNIFRGIFGFLVADLIVIFLLMVFPDIILFLPNVIGK